jgi:hypothetical protein
MIFECIYFDILLLRDMTILTGDTVLGFEESSRLYNNFYQYTYKIAKVIIRDHIYKNLITKKLIKMYKI